MFFRKASKSCSENLFFENFERSLVVSIFFFFAKIWGHKKKFQVYIFFCEKVIYLSPQKMPSAAGDTTISTLSL